MFITRAALAAQASLSSQSQSKFSHLFSVLRYSSSISSPVTSLLVTFLIPLNLGTIPLQRLSHHRAVTAVPCEYVVEKLMNGAL